MRIRKYKTYFSSIYNILDLTGYTCGLIWAISFLLEIKGNYTDLELEALKDDISILDVQELKEKAEEMATVTMNESPLANLGIVIFGMVVIGRLTDIFFMF